MKTMLWIIMAILVCGLFSYVYAAPPAPAASPGSGSSDSEIEADIQQQAARRDDVPKGAEKMVDPDPMVAGIVEEKQPTVAEGLETAEPAKRKR